jgi:hypothetical protein
MPAGEVVFTVDGVDQPAVPLINGQAVFTTSTLTAGGHTVFAKYLNSDGHFSGSQSAPLPAPVAQAATTTALASSGATSVFGQTVTFTAMVNVVSPGAGSPSGTVTFIIDGAPQPNVAVSNCQAVLSTASLAPGSHTVTATYNGDTNFQGSGPTSVTQTVNRANTVITLQSSVDPSMHGQLVTFTATVSAVSPGAGTPSGLIAFFIDGHFAGIKQLSNGVAKIVRYGLSVGDHAILALYLGDADFSASLSLPLDQIVNPRKRHHH